MTNLVSRTASTERRLGILMAAVLVLDACLHLYWATEAIWPAADEFALSVAVLGFGVDFRPGLLLPLALLLTGDPPDRSPQGVDPIPRPAPARLPQLVVTRDRGFVL